MPPHAGLAGAARAGLGGGGVAGLNPALTQQGLANRNATAGGVQGLSAGGGMGGYSANLAALQVCCLLPCCWCIGGVEYDACACVVPVLLPSCAQLTQ